MTVVRVENLVKRFGEVEAVGGISFEVRAGEVFALLGPNGAGKTTTVEILEGFVNRTSGQVAVFDIDPGDRSHERHLRERMGVVLQELAVEPFLTVRQVLTRNAGYYPSPRPVEEVLRLIGLESKADDRIRTLSGGQQRRLDLGLGIIGNPDILFLDEPTTGFDPSARREAWDVVRSLTGGGTTVILTTHYMEEAEALANRIAVISAGRLVAEGSPQSLGGRDAGDVHIRFKLPPGTAVGELPVAVTALHDDQVEIRTSEAIEVLNALTGWALERRLDLPGLSVERLTLEDVYLRLTGYRPEGATETVRP